MNSKLASINLFPSSRLVAWARWHSSLSKSKSECRNRRFGVSCILTSAGPVLCYWSGCISSLLPGVKCAGKSVLVWVLEYSSYSGSFFGESGAYGVDSGVEYVFACFGHVVQHAYDGWCGFDDPRVVPFIGLFILSVQVFSSMSIPSVLLLRQIWLLCLFKLVGT
jgi:hypothetical protein